ncbi:hypothetical protein OGAPHI_004000 [Ogataea philodendri]|uniref:BZIP domain-containing protein n=1 Tax=Ogataea philodendri TaxID=1378263 RepID=A0A9P8P5T9_9ASCO|nr:uncharacterized protein OGAPHI_004000 [Ogataea philodendri]KAH3665812.1 hypothetical protein OGAPHI_004000 [Ogataea philodendri]
MTTLTSSHQRQEVSNDVPLGSLPPRKRAKTEEEKEQRRVERILRNRRAAHASREKKRRHVEYLENYVKDLESCLAIHEENQDKTAQIISGLTSLLSENSIDFSSVDTSLEPCGKVERPDGLELTGLIPTKKQKTSYAKTSKKLKSAIPSPSFDEDLLSSEEDDNNDIEMSVEDNEDTLQVPETEPVSEPASFTTTNSQKRKAQDAYISPPGSTSPSKLKLEEDEGIAKQEYSNLFDDTEDIFSGDKSSSLELYKQDLKATSYIKQEEDEMLPFIKREDDLKFPESGFSSDDCHLIQVEDLCSFNSVHHPAVMISNIS